MERTEHAERRLIEMRKAIRREKPEVMATALESLPSGIGVKEGPDGVLNALGQAQDWKETAK